MNQDENSAPEPADIIKTTNALCKWKAEAGGSPDGIDEVRLDQNERLLIPFTTSVVEIQVHFLDYHSYREFVRCNGPHCIRCRIGQQPDTRDLLPVFDVIARTVAVLPVSPNQRPRALRPELFPVLQRLVAGLRQGT
jgi:hypothetical protein